MYGTAKRTNLNQIEIPLQFSSKKPQVTFNVIYHTNIQNDIKIS